MATWCPPIRASLTWRMHPRGTQARARGSACLRAGGAGNTLAADNLDTGLVGVQVVDIALAVTFWAGLLGARPRQRSLRQRLGRWCRVDRHAGIVTGSESCGKRIMHRIEDHPAVGVIASDQLQLRITASAYRSFLNCRGSSSIFVEVIPSQLRPP